MTKFMFWNVHREPFIENDGSGSLRLERLQEIISSEGVDVLVLCEFVDDANDFITKLSENLSEVFRYHPSPTVGAKTYLFSRLPPETIRHIQSSNEYECHIVSVNGIDILLISLHLISKLHAKEHNQYDRAYDVADDIRSLESTLGHNRTVVVGDFNMNPFELGMAAAKGFNAVMDRQIAQKKVRKIRQKSYPYFYNPMWNCFGDDPPGAPGTYYYPDDSDGQCYFWNMFDQVLLRPEMLPFFKEGGVMILTSTGPTSLLTGAGTPAKTIGSDHLPLLFQLNI